MKNSFRLFAALVVAVLILASCADPTVSPTVNPTYSIKVEKPAPDNNTLFTSGDTVTVSCRDYNYPSLDSTSQVSTDDPNGVLRYTIDGSTPTFSSASLGKSVGKLTYRSLAREIEGTPFSSEPTYPTSCKLTIVSINMTTDVVSTPFVLNLTINDNQSQ
jgi:hypothetical protein